jgi:outer membrane lipoprotein-sorting protein
VDTHVLEQRPLDKNSGYTRQKVWVDKNDSKVFKIEFYDRKNKLLKVLVMEDYKLYKDKFWRAHRSEMTNEQTGKSTVLLVDEIRFDTGLKESDFNSNKLRNAR